MAHSSLQGISGAKMDWKRIEPYDYIVKGVAQEYHRRFQMVDIDDIRQSLYEWFVLKKNKFSEWEALPEKEIKNLLFRSLRNQALDYCQFWKSRSLGYELSDLYYYDPETIEMLLPAVLRGDKIIAAKVDLGFIGNTSTPSEGGNLMAMLAEVEGAYKKLNDIDSLLLHYRYVESMEFGAIAQEMGLASDDAARMRHNRAIKKMITRLGGFRPYREKDSLSPIEPDIEQGIDETPRYDEED